MRLTSKQKTKLAAIVIFKFLKREINAIRKGKLAAIPDNDDAIIDAIAANLNASTGKLRKTKPRQNENAQDLYYALRYRLRKNSGQFVVYRSIFETGSKQDEFDTIAFLIVENSKRIAEYAKQAIGGEK